MAVRGAVSVVGIVHADHQKELLWLGGKDAVEAKKDAPGRVASNAAVDYVFSGENLCPFARLGDRVAQKDNIHTFAWEDFEKAFAVVIFGRKLT